MSSTARQVFLLFVMMSMLLFNSCAEKKTVKTISREELTAKIQRGEIAKVTITSQEVLAVDEHGNEFHTDLKNDAEKKEIMEKAAEKHGNNTP